MARLEREGSSGRGAFPKLCRRFITSLMGRSTPSAAAIAGEDPFGAKEDDAGLERQCSAALVAIGSLLKRDCFSGGKVSGVIRRPWRRVRELDVALSQSP